MDGGAVFIYLGVAFLIMTNPLSGNLVTRVLLAIFWPLVFALIAITFPLRILIGDY